MLWDKPAQSKRTNHNSSNFGFRKQFFFMSKWGIISPEFHSIFCHIYDKLNLKIVGIFVYISLSVIITGVI